MTDEYPKAKFSIGDKVAFELEGEVEGVPTRLPHTAIVIKIWLESDESKRFLRYGLTDDPCAPYYAGKGLRWSRNENQLSPAP